MIRTISLLCLCLSAFTVAKAQLCQPPNASYDLEANTVRARIRNGGHLFTQGQKAGYTPILDPVPGAVNASTIFSSGLWLGAIDPGVNLRLALADYYNPSQGADFWPGPLNADGQTDQASCANWDVVFSVKGVRIDAFLKGLPLLTKSAALSQFPEIMGWPGRGNPYFTEVWGFDLPIGGQGLAPFFDYNQDAVYDPLKGDYPVVLLQNVKPFVPAEITWCVFNDQGGGAFHASGSAPLQFEIQLTAWAFNCPDQPVLNRTVFTSHKFTNHSLNFLDSLFLGLWVDFDLGCPDDDFLGFKPNLNCFYAYNTDAVDGSQGANCGNGVPTFAEKSPVQSVTFLNKTLDRGIYYNNPSVGGPLSGTTDPATPLEVYRYLSGVWRDGTKLTAGGSGYDPDNPNATPAHFPFPDDPADVNGWTMCSANLAPGDRRVLASHEIKRLDPGGVAELTCAWAYHPFASLPCNVGNTFSDVATLKSLYDGQFAGVCSPLTATDELAAAAGIGVFPNPASQTVTLRYGDLPVENMVLLAADGRLALRLQNLQPAQTELAVQHLPAGLYTVQLYTAKQMFFQKIAIVH